MKNVAILNYNRFMEKKPYSELGYKIWFKIKPFAKLLFRLKVEGAENFPKEGGFIIAANHRSYLDPPIINTISPFPVIFMAKEDLFKVPILGSIITKAGAIPVERGRKGVKSLIKAIDFLKKGYVIGIFPEGTRAAPGKFLKPQPGIGLLIEKTKVPVVPVRIEGADKVLSRDSKFPKFLVYPIKVKVGKPIKFEDNLSHEEMAKIIMEKIKAL